MTSGRVRARKEDVRFNGRDPVDVSEIQCTQINLYKSKAASDLLNEKKNKFKISKNRAFWEKMSISVCCLKKID